MANNIYIGNRYVPVFANPVEWDNLRSFEPLTIVTYQGTSYTSKKQVPVGTLLNNTEYWVVTGNFNQQLLQCLNDISAAQVDIDANTTAINSLKAGGVNDGSLALAKLTPEALELIKNDYVHVEYFGAKGDGTTDDTTAINNCFAYCITNNKTAVFLNKTYLYNGSSVTIPNIKGNNTKLKGNMINLFLSNNCRVENITVNQDSNGEAGCFVCESVKDKIEFYNVKYVGGGKTSQPFLRLSCKSFAIKDIFLKNISRGIIYSDGYSDSVNCIGEIDHILCNNANTVLDFECTKKITGCNICNVQQYNDVGYATYSSGNDTLLMGGCKYVTVSNITGINVGERVIYINTTDYLTVDNVTSYDCELMKYAGLQDSISNHAVIKNLTGIRTTNHGFTLYDVSDVNVEDVYLSGNGLSNSDLFDIIHQVSAIRIKNVTMENTYGNGFLIHNDRGIANAISNVWIDGLTLRNIGTAVEYAPIRLISSVANGINNVVIDKILAEPDKAVYKSNASSVLDCTGTTDCVFSGEANGYAKPIIGSVNAGLKLTLRGAMALNNGYSEVLTNCYMANIQSKYGNREIALKKLADLPASLHIVGTVGANEVVQVFSTTPFFNGTVAATNGRYDIFICDGVFRSVNPYGASPGYSYDAGTKTLVGGAYASAIDIVATI